MQRYVARENIKRFKGRLENCSDERERETLKQLLASEEEKLEELERNYGQSPQGIVAGAQRHYAPSEIPADPTQA